MAKLSINRIAELGSVAVAKEGAFYTTVAQAIGKCHFIKPSSNATYANSFSGLVDIYDAETAEVIKDVWCNFSPNQIDELTPINTQLIGAKRLPVIVEELQVATTATPEDLVKYNKKVGDAVLRISFL